MPFDGLRVLSLESRRAAEMEVLIRKQGGEAFVAPSMREIPLDHNEEAFAFGRRQDDPGPQRLILRRGRSSRQLVESRSLHRI